MSKPSPTPAPLKSNEPTTGGPKSNRRTSHQDASRETLESIAFAFVLALLFRTFIAEAFVIPTGSMAPTLFGRNKDVVCSECHYKYQVGASEEVNDDGYLICRIDESMCPNCRHMNNIRDLLAFKGDRILVNKFPYQLGDPDRWDVIVFRYPEDNQKNYIKRLVGLPGEELKISRGDVYARKGGEGPFEILRKENPNKQKVLQQLVYDDRNPPADLLAKGWPERWNAMSPSESAVHGWGPDDQGWKGDRATRSFSIESNSDTKWVRYQHLIPHREDWNAAAGGSDPASGARPQLITDFCGYNAYTGGRDFHGGDNDPNLHDDRFWVGDLTLNCTVEIKSVSGSKPELVFELVEGVRRYRCRIDVTTGEATLVRNDELSADPVATELKMKSAPTPIHGPGKYTITFANVDNRLCLWVNSGWTGSGLIPFGKDAEYKAPVNPRPQQADLAPVGFAARDIAVKVSELVLQRDIYYRADFVPNGRIDGHESELPGSMQIGDSVYDPIHYGELYHRHSQEVTFRALGSDEFFAMGDNSPRSQDSRLWSNHRYRLNRHAVPRQALLGKAFFIYWPHGIPFLNHGKGFTLRDHVTLKDFNEEPVVETYPEYVFPFYPQWWRWKRIQ